MFHLWIKWVCKSAIVRNFAWCRTGELLDRPTEAINTQQQNQLNRLLSELKLCSRTNDLVKGRIVHASAVQTGHGSNIYVVNSVVNMYAQCGSMAEARKVFDEHHFHLTVVSWNSLILGYVNNEDLKSALKLFSEMQLQGFKPDDRTFVAASKACTRLLSRPDEKQAGILKGTSLHLLAAESGLESDRFVAGAIVDFYVKCGLLPEACGVFDRMTTPTVAPLTSLMMGHIDYGLADRSLEIFERTRNVCSPDARVLIAALKACSTLAAKEVGKDDGLVKVASLERTMAIHSEALKLGCVSDIFFANSLVDTYAKCGSLLDSRRFFDRMASYNVVVWNALISGYIENGEESLGLEFFWSMPLDSDARTFAAAAKACANMAANDQSQEDRLKHLEQGMKLHSKAANSGFDMDIFLASSLISMYSKCGSLLDAQRVFDTMPAHNLVVWNSLILGYVDNGEPVLALKLFARLQQQEQIQADGFTFVAALKASSSLAANEEAKKVDGKLVKIKALETGRSIYLQYTNSRIHASDILLKNTALDLFCKCGSVNEAWRLFESFPCHNVVTWNVLMLGYSEYGQGELALQVLARMQATTGCPPDSRSYVAAFKACSSLASTEVGQLIDGKMVKVKALAKGISLRSQTQAGNIKLETDIFLANTAMDMYSKCGSLGEARKIFEAMPRRTTVSWTVMLLGYVESGEAAAALELFWAMVSDPTSPVPSSLTFVAALKACSSLASKEPSRRRNHPVSSNDSSHLESDQSPSDQSSKLVKAKSLKQGRAVHLLAVEHGFELDVQVSSNLIDMYSRCRSMADAQDIFDRIPRKNPVSWTALIVGHAESGDGQESLASYFRMRLVEKDLVPDTATFVAALKAAGLAANLHTAKMVEADIYRSGLESEFPESETESEVTESESESESEFLATCLIDVHGKCGSSTGAQRIFDGFPSRYLGAAAWNSLVAAYSRGGDTQRMLETFWAMVEQRRSPDSITFVAVLAGLSHAGLVDAGLRVFEGMEARFGVAAGIEHHACVVDMLGRGNRLGEAIDVLMGMPYEDKAVAWRSVLGSCRKWGNVVVGKDAYESLLKLDEKDCASYVLMANIHRDEQC